MRVFFDASVIIAAVLSRTGGSALLLRFIKTGRIVGVTSQTVIEEVVEGDKPTKLNTPKEEIELFIAGSGLVVREAITATETVQNLGGCYVQGWGAEGVAEMHEIGAGERPV